jgi:hypothetical protein
MEVCMKKVAFTGILLLSVMFLVTCGMDQSGGGGGGGGGPHYVDYLVSADGSRVTLYLDGTKVPAHQSQRAMTTDLAIMAFDYLEVVFDSSRVTGGGIARTAWEIGQPAGISGVYRDTLTNYAWDNTAANTGNAAIFVGRKDGKTLLGVGKLAEVYDVGDTPGSPSRIDSIGPDTVSITFSVMAIKTGLTAGSEAAAVPGGSKTTTSPYIGEIEATSFIFKEAFGPSPTYTPIGSYPGTGTNGYDTDNSKRSGIGSGVAKSSTAYPLYILPTTVGSTTVATYTFYGAAETYADIIRHYGGRDTVAIITQRTPRYLANSKLWYPQNEYVVSSDVVKLFPDTATISGMSPSPYTSPGYDLDDNDPFTTEIQLLFTTTAVYGVFSFNLGFPVYCITKGASSNGGPAGVKWYIKTGLDSELHSLDDGLGRGGSVFMSIGSAALDWIDIDYIGP